MKPNCVAGQRFRDISNPYFGVDRYVRPIDSPTRFWLNCWGSRIDFKEEHNNDN